MEIYKDIAIEILKYMPKPKKENLNKMMNKRGYLSEIQYFYSVTVQEIKGTDSSTSGFNIEFKKPGRTKPEFSIFRNNDSDYIPVPNPADVKFKRKRKCYITASDYDYIFDYEPNYEKMKAQEESTLEEEES